jgi:hypothetical protein
MFTRFALQKKQLALATLVNLIFTCAFAQQSDPARINQLEQKLEHSLKVIEQLQQRVQDLENGRASTKPATNESAPASHAERIEAVEQKVTAIQESSGKSHGDIGIPVHGFADVGYGEASAGAGENRANGFAIGTFSLYLTPQFTDRTKALIELAFEGDSAEGTIATDLERLQFGYTFNDLATVWVGRFHTPFGYWNTAYHHGAQIQISVLRPKFLDFEDKGGIIPAHMVGLLASGLIPAGKGKIVYDAYLGNGSRIVDDALDPNITRDDNSNKALGANVGYRFSGALSGLQIGGHLATQQVNSYSGSTLLNRTRVNMIGGYAVYENDTLEILSELYSFRNKDLSGDSGTHSSWAGYAQGGYRFGDWLPYARIEKTSLSQSDNYFTNQASGRAYSRYALGVRYELNEAAALKLEANRTRQPDQANADYNEAWFQYAIRF